MKRPATMKEDTAMEEARQIKRAVEDDDGAEECSPKRLKPPPRWWWEDEATATVVLHGVREEQATLYDPKLRGFDLCRGFGYHVMSSSNRHGAVFDFDHDEESTDRVARQLDTIPESERDNLQLALNVLHLKVLASDVGFPISVYGTVLMRDKLDFKCIYLFQRDRDNCQVISAPDELLTLTGPNRGPFEATIFYFEINLKIRGEEQSMDRIFSRTLAREYYPLDQWTHKQEISSWLSTLELACRSVHYAVEATVGITILRGPREFYGSVVACTSQDSNDMVLYDSQRSGAHVATAGADGSVALPRHLVVLREDEDLVLKITTVSDCGGHRAKPKTTVLTVGHVDTSFYIKQEPYRLQATVSWAGIL